MYDLPHVTAIKKRLLAASKAAKCFAIARWITSIIHHLYWCGTSTEGTTEFLYIC